MNKPDTPAPLAQSTNRSIDRDLPELTTHGYQVVEKLSQRADGERITYLAQDLKFDRLVVIKEWRMPDPNPSNLDDYAAYLPAIDQLQQLHHPQLPLYLNSFSTPTGFCVVREYKSGVSLAELKTLTPGGIKSIGDAVLQILVDLQQLDPIVIHQNIKPENIIVNTEAKSIVYLVDFGLNPQHNPRSILATPGFIPPEQIFNRKLTSAADLYSLGMSLICLLVGKTTPQAQDLLDDRCYPEFHHLLPAHTPPELIVWLDNMVEPNEHRRYPNAASAANPSADLSPEHIQPRLIDTMASIGKPRRKISWWQWGLGAAGLLGVALLLRPLIFPDADELSPAQIAKNQNIVSQAAFESSDRGQLIKEKRCTGCNLNYQDFAKAELPGAVLSQSNLKGTNFANANLRLANFYDADLSDANLQHANLQNAAFYGTKLMGTNLVGANLSNAKLIYAKLKGAWLSQANLSNADLKFAEFVQVDLTDTNLTGANLSNADLSYANLRRTILSGANLSNTKLTGATMPNGSVHP